MSVIGRMGKKAVDMSAFFSEVAANVKASDVRELLKILIEPDVISFAGGIFLPDIIKGM